MSKNINIRKQPITTKITKVDVKLTNVKVSEIIIPKKRIEIPNTVLSMVDSVVNDSSEYIKKFDFLKRNFEKVCERGLFNKDRFDKILKKFNGQNLAKFFMYGKDDYNKIKNIIGVDKSKVGGFYNRQMKLGFVNINDESVPLWHELVAVHESIGHHNENYDKSPLLKEAYPYLMEYKYFLEAQKKKNDNLNIREDRIFENNYSRYRAKLVNYWASLNPEQITENLAYHTFSPFVMTGSQLNKHKFSGYPRNAVATLNMISYALDIPNLTELVADNAQKGDSEKIFNIISSKNKEVAKILLSVKNYSRFTAREFNGKDDQQSYSVFSQVYKVLRGNLLEKSKNLSEKFPPDSFGAGVLISLKDDKFLIEIPEFLKENDQKKGKNTQNSDELRRLRLRMYLAGNHDKNNRNRQGY